MAEGSKEVNGADDAQDLHSLLSSPERDFLIRNDGEQVKIDSLKGKKIGLYFSASWCSPCHMFTRHLLEAYNELSPKACFEVVFVSCDKDEESFGDYFAKMPWLAVPFTDQETRDGLYDEIFKVKSIPNVTPPLPLPVSHPRPLSPVGPTPVRRSVHYFWEAPRMYLLSLQSSPDFFPYFFLTHTVSQRTSRKITHHFTTPAQARLTLEFFMGR
ncbi:unnamed protein product [Microthlaspi erraticum]|uniref:protein-disulfide reductase n=1 Tax=Microthlaspi erraticum TaxID=1685480 RepID=A0A6D2HWI7_9BRAS|nr:unnamed protein product [Microthlaspi erraticum]